MAAEQIGHQRRRAFVRDDDDVDAGLRLEVFGGHIAAGAERRGADIELAGLLLGEGDESATDFAGNDGWAISAIGIEATRPIGAKSLRGS